MQIKQPFIIMRLFFILLALLSLMACVCFPTASKFDAGVFLASQENKISNCAQIILVADNSSFFRKKTTIYAMEKRGEKWQMAFEPFNATIGKNGFAPPGEKREGDGRTPSGIFPLQLTFGYDESVKTKMPYRQTLEDDLWVDDSNADDYNRWVKKTETSATSYEKMRRDDNLYKYGIVIEYNTNPVIKGYGSAIFFHVWGGEYISTAGCVAVSDENMIKILDWLDPAARPVIITGIENSNWRIP